MRGDDINSPRGSYTSGRRLIGGSPLQHAEDDAMRTTISLLADRSGPLGAHELSSMIPALLFPPDSPSAPRETGVDMDSPD
jgi:hypothetical protein